MTRPSSVDLISPANAGTVLVVSPHDDDGVVGCGGFIANLPVPPVVVIASDGRLGYHSLAERNGFAERREREALDAYGRIGVPPDRIRFLRYPDMSVRNYQSWETPDGHPGPYQELFRVIRDYRPSTVFLPSELDFHPDHKVIAEAGLVACVQAGETLMPELGPPATIRRIYAYQVWESLREPVGAYPLDARSAAIKRSAIAAFASQADAFARMEQLGTLRYGEERLAPVRAFDAARESARTCRGGGTMDVRIFESKPALAAAAAVEASGLIRAAIAATGHARLIAATGAAQFEFLEALAEMPGIEWSRTEFFHLDEYIGLPTSHPASFRRFLTERIIDRVHPGAFHLIDGEAADPHAECARLGALITSAPLDLAFVGIGENGHLAFNDPPADFTTETPYLVVQLDERCRRQQLGEGWFPRLEDVPTQAISMSVRQVLKSRRIIAIVPDRRKAEAVQQCLELDVSVWRPSSALRWHTAITMYLDRASSSLLSQPPHA